MLEIKYNQAKRKLDKAILPEECEEAKKLFESISSFRDAYEMQNECSKKATEIIYKRALADMRLISKKNVDINSVHEYERIGYEFQRLGDYRNAPQLTNECFDKSEKQRLELYNQGCKLIEQRHWQEAISIFKSLGDYNDSVTQVIKITERKKAEKKREEKRCGLISQQEALQKELSNLRGLFSGKRRREIQSRLLEIRNELSQI